MYFSQDYVGDICVTEVLYFISNFRLMLSSVDKQLFCISLILR